MIFIQLVFDLTFLFLSLVGALLIRPYLPFGEPIYHLPNISPGIYTILAGSWVLLAIGLHQAFEGAKRAHKQFFFIGAVILFSLFEFFLVKSNNLSFSRLFLPLFLGLNLAGLTISRNLKRQQGAITSSLQKLIQEPATIYMKVNDSLRHYYAEIVIAFLASFLWAANIIKMGLTLTSDSITYLESALKLSVDGELVLSVHWPPLYPIVISSTKIFTAFPADGAAIISALSVVVFFCIFALLLRTYSRSAFFNVLLILLLASLKDFLSVFQSAWSEQLYSVLLIVNFYLLVKHQKGGQYISFLGAVLFAGLGMVTRYIGISMGLVLILYTFIYKEPGLTLKKRITKYTAIACASFLPLVILIAWNYSSRGSGIGYTFALFPILETVQESLQLIWSNIGWSYLVPLIVLQCFIISFVSGHRKAANNSLLLLSMIFPVGYAALTIGAFVTTSAHPQIRYFSPVYFFFFLSIAYLVDYIQTGDFARAKMATKLRPLILGFTALVLLFAGWQQSIPMRTVLFDRVSSARNNPLQQRTGGFDLSLTAQQLSHFFGQISDEHNDITILVIEGDYDKRTMVFEYDFRWQTVFLFRSSTFRLAAFDRFAFTTAEKEKQILQFTYAGQPKELTFLLIDPNSINDWLSQTAKSGLEEANPENVYLIINELWFDSYAEDLFGKNLQALKLKGTARPYLIYQLTPNQ